MNQHATGVLSLFLMLLLIGCANSPQVITQTPDVPPYLLKPLPAPDTVVKTNRDLVDLLSDYEAIRRKANADRMAVSIIVKEPNEED